MYRANRIYLKILLFFLILINCSFAEEIIAAEDLIRIKPKSLNWEQAASFTVAYLTAYVALVCRGNIENGESLLVHGAAGGVGLAAVDLGNYFGAIKIL